ncbi:MAG: hypothetical protein Q9179_005169 [Wetmoreana sp. 5 TL-2023]
MLATLDARGFSHLLDSIVNSYGNEARSASDMEFRNHVLFLQHTQTYLLLRYAIKRADIGLLRRAVDRCCLYFHGSAQHKYAYEMLYLQRLISTSAASPELQRAILANGLVNPRGAADGWFETDRLVELHNGTLKKLFKDRRGGRTVKYEAADILHLGAARVAGDAMVKFNGTECSSSGYDYMGTDGPVLDEEDNEDEGGVAQFFGMDDIEQH